MAVVVDKKDVDLFLGYAAQENLEAVPVAVVTEEPRLVMNWRGEDHRGYQPGVSGHQRRSSGGFRDPGGSGEGGQVLLSVRPDIPDVRENGSRPCPP